MAVNSDEQLRSQDLGCFSFQYSRGGVQKTFLGIWGPKVLWQGFFFFAFIGITL